MKILFVGFHNPYIVNTFIYREKAIRELGHQLIFFEDRNYILPGRVRQRFGRLQQWDQKRLNNNLVKLAHKARPDLCMVVGGYFILPETLLLIKRMQVKVILWTTDPPRIYSLPTDVPRDIRDIIKTAHFYDHVFCAGTEALEILKDAGIPEQRLSWLPFACDPDCHRQLNLSDQQRKRYAKDIVLIGAYYPNRGRILEAIADLDIATWGPCWRQLNKDSPLRKKARETRLNYDQWVKVYNASKIAIAIHYQDGKILCNQASPKIYEALACKGFVLSDKQKDAQALFEDNKHLVFFEDAQDLRQKVLYYLDHPDKREEIASCGYQEVLEKHTYKHRIRQMLEVIGPNIKVKKDAKVKVLHIVQDLKVGGLEQTISSVVEQLNKDKYDPQVMCITKGGDIADELIAKGKNVQIFGIKLYYNPINMLRLVFHIRKAKPQIIHTHGYLGNTMGRIAAILSKVPIKFSHLQSTYFYYSKRNLMIERLLSLFTDKIICCCDAVRQFALDYEKIKPNKLITIYNSADLGRLNQSINIDKTRKRFKLSPNDKVIGSVGHLEAVKGYRYLIKAAQSFEGRIGGIKFLIVGEGAREAELKSLTKELPLETKIIFTGKQRDVFSLLKVMDIFVLPSLREGLPISVVEAMALGLPVVATNVGGVPELVKDGVSGILVPAEDPVALAEAINSLLKDRQKAKLMGQAGQRIYREKFSFNTMMESIEELYSDSIEQKTKSQR